METLKLGDLCEIVSGGTPLRTKKEYWENGNIPWLKIGNIKNKYVDEADEYITELGLNNSSTKLLKKGTILYTIFATLGEVGILTFDACTNQAIAGLTIKDEDKLRKDYLYYYLKSKKSFVNDVGRGVAQNNINMSILRNFEVPIIGVYEQEKVIRELNLINDQISLKKQELVLLDELVKSRFIELFGDPKYNNKNIKLVNPEYVCESISAGGDKPKEVSEEKTNEFIYPIYSNGEKDNGLYGWSKEYRIEKPAVTVSGRGTIGFTAFRSEGKFTPIVRLIVMIPNKKINPIYLTYYMNMERETGSGSGVQQLTVPMIKTKKIMLPELELQNQFAEFVEKVDKSKSICQQKINHYQELLDKKMDEYFNVEANQ